MASNMKAILTLGVGFLGGWAARSLSDSPHGAGVKLLSIAMHAKERASNWAAVEGERLEDMLAEARSKVGLDVSSGSNANGSAHEARRTNGAP